jgi:hypothetical protein
MVGGKRSRDHGRLAAAVAAAKATLTGCFASAWLLFALACLCGWAAPATAQTTPSFTAPAAYNAQPGTVPVGIATGVFNNTSGYLDFAVLEQVPNGSGDQVEIFHGNPDGTFCTNCSNPPLNPNPDVVPLGAGVTGNAIAVGQFRALGPNNIAVATNTGIVFLQNDGSGIFTLSSTAISSLHGFASLAVGQFDGTGNYGIAAVSPAAGGIVSFTVYFGNGNGAFTQSSTYSVSSGYVQCSAILPGSFQGLTNAADLGLLCNTLYEEEVLVYLNLGHGTFGLYQTLDAGQRVVGVGTGVAVGTLNSLPAIFISPPAGSFTSYQFVNYAFTSVFMAPVGLAPRGSLALLPQTGAAVDFATGSTGVGISTFTGYTQSGTSVSGSWSSTEALGPAGLLATGVSPLTQGLTYVVVDAGVHTGAFPINLEPYVDERSISVYLVTLNGNGNGTVATTNAAPVYSGTASFTTGDFTGDGKMDLAVAGGVDANGNATLTIYLADSQSGILAATSSPVVPSTTVNIGAYNSVDAVVAGKFRSPAQTAGKAIYDLAVFSAGQIFVLPSNGGGTFSSMPSYSYSLSADPNYPGFYFSPRNGHPFAAVLTAVDVNGDGFDDIVLTLPEYNCHASGSVSQGAVYVLLSKGDGTFQNPVFVPPPVVNPVSVTAAKFFGTSLKDLVFADGGEICKGNTATTALTAVGILQNSSALNTLNFTPSAVLSQGSDLGVPNITAVASADLDGNGSPDLVVSSTNGIQVLLNSGTGSFSLTQQMPLYAGDSPGVFCTGSYAGCVTYDSQLATGSFFAIGENDVAVSAAGVVYIFQNNSGTLMPPTQGFVAGPDSEMLSAALVNPTGLNHLLVATSQGTSYLANNGQGSVAGPPAAIPIISPNGGSFISPQTATITDATSGATIYYTTDGTIPTTSSLVYSGTITVSASETISAIAMAIGFSQSPVASAVFTVTAPPPPPPPQISSVVPDIGAQGQQTLQVTITGANFVSGSTTVTFGGGNVGITVVPGSLTVTPTSATATLNIPPTTQAGNYDVVVTVSGAPPPATLAGGFIVAVSVPTVTEATTVHDQVTITPLINVVAPVAYFSVGSVGFGGQSGSQTLTVSDIGLAPLTLISATTSSGSPFSITQVTCSNGATSAATTLPSGGACTLTISYTSSGTPTADSDTLVFTDNAALSNFSTTASGANYTQSISLSGSGSTTAPPVPPLATVPIPNDTETTTVNDHVTITPLINVAAPVAYFSDGSVRFGGQSGSQTLTVSDIGLAALTLVSATTSNGSPFSITQVACSNGATSVSTTLPSGGACTLTISYTASGTPAADSDTLVFTDNAALSNFSTTASGANYTQSISLSGSGSTTGPPAPPLATVPIPTDTEITTVNDQVTVTPLINFAGPAASFSTAGLGFNGQSSVQPLTVSNVGEAPLVFSGAPVISAGSGSFTITQTVCSNGAVSLPPTLPSGGACTLTISYAASATPASDSGTIVFTDNAVLSSPASSGTGPTYTQTITLNGTGSGTGPILPPSATVTITTINEPITVNDQVTPTPLINFAGPAAAFSDSSLGFNNTAPSSQNLTVSNVGNAPLAFIGSYNISSGFSVGPILCSDGTTSMPSSLAIGAQCTFTISYAGTVSTGTITFTDNAALSNPASTPSGSNYTQTIQLNGPASSSVVIGPPSATVTIPTINEPITVTDTPGVFNTSSGADVTITPVDTTTGNTPVTLTFANVTQPGLTNLTTSQSGPSVPTGFQLGNPGVYYNISTTAVYTGSVMVCINYTGITFTQPPQLFHYQNGAWANVTTSTNTIAMIVCGTTTSFSPFALFQPSAFPTTTAVSAVGITYGTAASVTVSVSATSGTVAGNVSLSVDGGTASTLALTNGSAVFNLGVLNAATHALSASFVAQGNFLASSAVGMISVAQAPLKIAANNATRVYGSANPTLTASYSGFVNGDTPSVLIGPLNCSTLATTASPVGTYAITCSGQSAANYSITYLPGELTVTRALLTITANNLVKNFDAPNPALTWTASGFVNGDSTSVLTTVPTCTTTATATSAVGSYPITCSGAAAANYTFTYVAGTLAVTCHYVSIGLSPSTVAEGGSITVSWTLRSCANATQTVAFTFTLSGPAQPDGCSPTKTEMFSLPPFALKPNTLESLSFPFKIPKGICAGTYTTTATTTINGQVVDTSSSSLTITAH